MALLLLPRLRVVFAGRLYIHPLEEAGKNIFQEIFVLFRRGLSSIGVNNNIFTASSINTRPPDLVGQGQIFVASHSLNCSFVLFRCTGMLVFKLELVHEVNEVITGPFTLFHCVNGSGHEWHCCSALASSRQAKSIVYFMIIFSGTKLLILLGPIVWDK
jgi:hypothetical protein